MATISQNSKAVFTIGGLVSFTGAIIWGTSVVIEWKTQQMNTSARIEKKLDEAIAAQWTRSDHERFAVRFERLNRALNIVIPDVNDRPGT